MPFATEYERAIHFAKHGHEFGDPTEIDYERRADEFMTGPRNLTTRECVRRNGTDRLRLNIANLHFGVAVVAKPIVVTHHIVPQGKIRRRGGIISYFKYECTRTDV